MVREEVLSAVLSEFAQTLTTDFPIQRILDHLVERIVDILPAKSAGVTLIPSDGVPHYIAASDNSALLHERLQTDLGDGPCVLAVQTGQAVCVADLATDPRFPAYSARATAEGLAAVYAFPLRHGTGRLGALDLYFVTPRVLDPHDLQVAQTLADVAAAYLLNAHARKEASDLADVFRHGSLHDPLTGLPNRRLLDERLEHAGHRALRSHTSAAVLFADLDRFKLVNDLHGHQIGDELLRAVAHRLSGLVRPGDTLARVSGDEFVFLCEDLQSAADGDILAERISRAFDQPFVLGPLELTISASIGVAFAGPGDQISDNLVMDADTAMYHAKRSKTPKVVDLRTSAPRPANGLEADLHSALFRDDLEVAYQPIVRTADGVMTGVEALLRWTHPVRGAVSAVSMIEVAERGGLIHRLGAWVLERSCEDHAAWLRGQPDRRIDLAVNVSGHQIMRPDFPRTVQDILQRTGMDADDLIIEITENVFIEDSDRAFAALSSLRDLGVRLALDDFGTGYSSLSYLQRLPVDIVKIDQTFIAGVGLHSAGATIVNAITGMAHALGLSVTAEGVETQLQLPALRGLGCDHAQGFHFSPAIPADAIAGYLTGPPASPFRRPVHGARPATPRGHHPSHF